MNIIDNAEGLNLEQDGDDYFVSHEQIKGISASLLFAYHEDALHDWNGQEYDLTHYQIRQVEAWADEYL